MRERGTTAGTTLRLLSAAAGIAAGAGLAGTPLAAADGALDPDFSIDGKRIVTWDASSFADSVLPVADGGILVAGRTGAGEWVVSRLDADGSLDATWAGEFEPIDFEPDGFQYSLGVHDLGVDPAGRVWLAGSVTNSVAYFPQYPALVRLTAAGTPDLSFDGDGHRWLPPPAGWSLHTIREALVLPGGGALFLGGCESCTAGGGQGFFVLKTNAAGSPDAAFSGDGWFAHQVDQIDDEAATAGAVGATGTVTLAAWGRNAQNGGTYIVARLTAAGLFDPSFGGGDGLSNLLTHSPRVPRDLAIDPDNGRIFLALGAFSGTYDAGAVSVLDAAGAVDLAWGANGVLHVDLEEGTRLDAIEVQSDGKAVAVGTIDANGDQRAGFFLMRATAGGDLDDSFDGNGVKRVEFDRETDAVDRGRAAALSGGRLVAVGDALDGSGDGAFAILRTTCALVFSDGFERASTGAWQGY